MRRIARKSILLGIFWLITIGCTPTEPEANPTTQTIEEGANPVIVAPTQAQPHTWETGTIIAMLYHGAGYTNSDYAFSLTPATVLYADGTLIYSSYDWSDNSRTIHRAHVEQAEICSLLYALETTGFFAFEQDDYQLPPVTDLDTAYIQVNGWETNHIEAYALGFDEDDNSAEPLVQTEQLLSQLRPENAEPYVAERVAVSITEVNPENEAPPWPLAKVPFEKLIGEMTDGTGTVLLEGEEARSIGELFATAYSAIYADGENAYQIAVRPLLPHQQYTDSASWHNVPVFEATESAEMTCPAKDPASKDAFIGSRIAQSDVTRLPLD